MRDAMKEAVAAYKVASGKKQAGDHRGWVNWSGAHIYVNGVVTPKGRLYKAARR